jgi:hypothetical protein
MAYTSFTDLDQVCINCDERFGQHFGAGRGHHYCDVEKYKFYDANHNIAISLKDIFINSGTCRSKFEKKGKIVSKDPNILFKMKRNG